MKSSKKVRPSKTGEPVLVRLQDDQLAVIDAWRRQQEDIPGRAEALRRLALNSPDAKATAQSAGIKGGVSV